jgi:hypothetical protein
MHTVAAPVIWVVASLLASGPLGPSVLRTQEDWLPPAFEERATQQLADRLSTLPMGDQPPLSPATRLERAREAVATFRTTLDEWGLEGTLSRAPTLADLGLPTSSDRLLDAMGRYQFCSLVLALQAAPSGQAENFNLQFTAVMGLTAGTMAVLYLRAPFAAAGGTDQELEAYMTSAGMEAVAARVQEDEALLDRARAGCTPIVVELVTKVLT